jgi:hypothetical protein
MSTPCSRESFDENICKGDAIGYHIEIIDKFNNIPKAWVLRRKNLPKTGGKSGPTRRELL